MPFAEINWNPTNRQLRQFGGIALVALPALGWWWSSGRWDVTGWLAAAGAAMALLGWVAPKGLAPVFVGLTLLTIPIGIVVGELALLCMYYLVFLPIGLAFRLSGRDALQRKFNRSSTTFWQRKRQARNAASYFRQS